MSISGIREGVPWAHSWEVRYPWGQDRPGFESRLCHFLRSDSDPCSPPWRHGEKAQGQGRGGSHSNPRHVLGWLRMARLPWWALGSGRHWTGRTHPDLGRERLQGQNPAQQLARTRDKWLLSKPVQLSPSLEQQWQVFWKMIIRVILPFNDIYGARTLGQVGGGAKHFHLSHLSLIIVPKADTIIPIVPGKKQRQKEGSGTYQMPCPPVSALLASSHLQDRFYSPNGPESPELRVLGRKAGPGAGEAASPSHSAYLPGSW